MVGGDGYGWWLVVVVVVVVVVTVVDMLLQDWGVVVWATCRLPSFHLVVGVVVVVVVVVELAAVVATLSRFNHIQTYMTLMLCTFVNLIVPSTKCR
jgi:hypothetical protein